MKKKNIIILVLTILIVSVIVGLTLYVKNNQKNEHSNNYMRKEYRENYNYQEFTLLTNSDEFIVYSLEESEETPSTLVKTDSVIRLDEKTNKITLYSQKTKETNSIVLYDENQNDINNDIEIIIYNQGLNLSEQNLSDYIILKSDGSIYNIILEGNYGVNSNSKIRLDNNVLYAKKREFSYKITGIIDNMKDADELYVLTEENKIYSFSTLQEYSGWNELITDGDKKYYIYRNNYIGVINNNEKAEGNKVYQNDGEYIEFKYAIENYLITKDKNILVLEEDNSLKYIGTLKKMTHTYREDNKEYGICMIMTDGEAKCIDSSFYWESEEI